MTNNNEPVVSFSLFSMIIFNPKNSIFDPELGAIKDMKQPLTSYYIFSSHNTYLTSNQLTGESSVEAYVHALSLGCRCVELDVWDGPNQNPIVYHGYTMTSKINFRDAIKTIEEFAFVQNPYPVILSIELHCSYE